MLQKPDGGKLVMNMIKRKTVGKEKESTRSESEKWCASIAKDSAGAFNILFPNATHSFVPLKNIHSGEIEAGQKKVNGNTF